MFWRLRYCRDAVVFKLVPACSGETRKRGWERQGLLYMLIEYIITNQTQGAAMSFGLDHEAES